MTSPADVVLDLTPAVVETTANNGPLFGVVAFLVMLTIVALRF